jgi:hypothetical protein
MNFQRDKYKDCAMVLIVLFLIVVFVILLA